MSDISIPGVTSRIDSGKIIDATMKLERIPLTRLEDQAQTYKEEKVIWQDVNRKISKLQESAKKLFGFQSPFGEKIGTSSDETLVTATVSREAMEDSRSLQIIKTAKPDRFLTASLDKNYTVPKGTYGFSAGDKEFTLTFAGGKLADFARQISEKSKGLLKATVIDDTKDSRVLLLETIKTGSANRLSLSGDSLEFGIASGMLETVSDASRTFALSRETVVPWTKPLNETDVAIAENSLLLQPGAEVSLPLEKTLSVPAGAVLSMEFAITNLPDGYAAPKPPPGPAIPEAGGINFQDIEIRNSPSQVPLPSWQPPLPPKNSIDMNIAFASTAEGRIIPLPALKDISGRQLLEVPLSDYVSTFGSLNLKNNNALKSVELLGARIYDPAARGDYRPLRAISQAQDAEFSMDGVIIKRESNEIDDVLPGTTIHILKEGKDPVNLTIEPNRKFIKDSIITFVGQYNQLITDINILTRTDGSVIENIDYFTDEERKTATGRLGILQGDITLNQLRNSLQRIMMDPYDTGNVENTAGAAGPSLSLLAQIGISTNSAQPGTGVSIDAAKLRGYLEINETALDENISSRLQSIRNLFGRDRDGDLVVDSGVAWAVDAYARPYTQSGGILATRLRNLDTQISRNSSDIETLNMQLSRKEQDLKSKYGQLEGTLSGLDQSSKAIENFSGSLNGNR